MSLKSPSKPEILGLGVLEVDDVSIIDGKITWPDADAPQQVRLDAIVAVLESKNSSGQFTVVHLEDKHQGSKTPSRISLLRTSSTSLPQLEKLTLREFPRHLMNNDDNRVDVIVSINAGTGAAEEIEREILRPMWELAKFVVNDELVAHDTKSDRNYELTVTQNAETVRDFARTAHSSSTGKRSRTIILLSGDGGVVDLLNGSDETPPEGNEPVISILPVGTGNALFHSSHKPLDSHPGSSPLILGLRTLFFGKPAPLPVFRASFSPGSQIVTFTDKSKGTGPADVVKEETSVSHLDGAIVASYGFHASIVYESDTPEYRIHGDKRFGMVAQELLKESHHYSAKVEIRRSGSRDFETIPRDTHAYVLTTIVSNLERKFTISPASKPLGRQMHLVHFGPVGGQRAMEIMMKAYDGGKHVGMKWDDGEKVGYDAVDEVRVTALEENERWRKVCIDGTIVEIPNGGCMSVKMLERSPFQVLVDPSVVQN